MQSEHENLAMEEEKQPYNTPKLIQHGTVETITGVCDQTIGASGCDFDGVG